MRRNNLYNIFSLAKQNANYSAGKRLWLMKYHTWNTLKFESLCLLCNGHFILEKSAIIFSRLSTCMHIVAYARNLSNPIPGRYFAHTVHATDSYNIPEFVSTYINIWVISDINAHTAKVEYTSFIENFPYICTCMYLKVICEFKSYNSRNIYRIWWLKYHGRPYFPKWLYMHVPTAQFGWSELFFRIGTTSMRQIDIKKSKWMCFKSFELQSKKPHCYIIL